MAQSTQCFIFFISLIHMLWVLIRSLSQALLMSIHNIYFFEEIRKLSIGFVVKSAISGAIGSFHLGPVVQTNDVIS